MTRRVVLATCAPLPEPDPDERPLVAALRAAGLDASVHAWDSRDAPWGEQDLVVLRSTWDYHHRPDAFVRWVEQTARVTRLLNPPPVVAWNAHKGYLLELEARGVPVTPTALLRRGASTTLTAVLGERGWSDVVIKPAVSAGSHLTLRATGATAEATAHLAGLLTARDVLVQPYLPAVETSGERAIVCIEGRVSHAVRKSPRFLGDDESVSAALPVADDERRLAERTLAAAGFGPLLYARVDVVRDGDTLRLMELELIEPSLFLLQHPPALAALVAAIGRAAHGEG